MATPTKFKTPLTHKADLASSTAPQQTFVQSAAKSLGFDEDDLDHNQSDSSSNEDDAIETVRAQGKTVPLSEYKALEKNLAEEKLKASQAFEALSQAKEHAKKFKAQAEKLKESSQQMKAVMETEFKTQLEAKDAIISELRVSGGSGVPPPSPSPSPLPQSSSGDGESSLRKLAEQLSAKIESLTAEKTAIETRSKELMVKLTTVTEQARKEQSDKEKAFEVMNDYQASIQQSEKTIMMLKDELAAMQETAGASQSDDSETIQRLQSELFELKSSGSQAGDQVGQLQSQIKELDAKHKEELSRADSLQKDIQTLQTELSLLKSSGAQAGDQAASLQKQVAHWESKHAEQQTRADNLDKTVQTLQDELSGLKSSGAKAGDLVTSLQTQLRDFETQVAEQTTRADGLKKELESAQAQLAAVTEELADTKASLQSASASSEQVAQAAKASEESLKTQIAELSKEKSEASSNVAALKTQLQELSAKNSQVSSQCATLTAERDQMKRKYDAMQAASGSTARAAAAVAQAAKESRQALVVLKKQAQTQVIESTKEFKTVTATMVRELAGVQDQMKDMFDRYRKEVVVRKKLHNQIIEMKGNIRVFCRCRPLSKDEAARGDTMAVTFGEDNDLALQDDVGKKRQFEFDAIYTPDSRQEQVFEDVEPLIISMLDGFNVCIFAYGQTGSGKTFTMEGPSGDPYANPGVNIRALSRLFEAIRERSADYRYQISVSVLEIYNENIHDLLVDPDVDKAKKHEVKEGPSGVFVENLSEVDVNDMESVRKLFQIGHSNRKVAGTLMNADSSRSHLVLSVKVVGENIHTHAGISGKLSLIDLAGSERVGKSGATGQQLKEASFINTSLSALGNTINALHQKAGHVPYRDSKLTRLLQDSLGGNSKMLMFVQISPAQSNSAETLCSLQFAQRVRKVELGAAKKNTEPAEMSTLRAQVRELQGALEKAGVAPTSASTSATAAARKR